MICQNPERLQQMIALYNTGKTLTEVGDAFNLTQPAVSYHFRRAGIEIRKPQTYWSGKTRQQYRREMIQRQIGSS